METLFLHDKAIVLVGDFNPKIFHPTWFEKEGLLSKEEVESEGTQIKFAHSEVTEFKICDWLSIQVTREKFQANTTWESHFERMRDLVLSAFDILTHTPIKMMGLNTRAHFRVGSEEKWHHCGDVLAPKEIWQKVFRQPGLASLTIKESIRDDGYKGNIRVTVEPSVKVQPGIYLHVLDHYEIADQKSVCGSNEMMQTLHNTWDDSCTRTEQIISTILEI